MATLEVVQLAVVLVLPLSLVATLLWKAGRYHGRTPAEIVTALALVVGCVAGIIAIAMGLNASRGGPLFDVQGLRLTGGGFRPIDAAGLVACLLLLRAALWAAGRLLRTAGPPEPEAEKAEAESADGQPT